ncbi:MAG: RluA family pseudouridine synthase [Candidatus Anoxymicrobium japonicum]|uniref:Pseudouridine synthase n=1 Tax=Candidatus Anoxymicrobium japonicum TaxID=2013648 RepID=A0A2N3G6K5_9ACTN|nr:MAG: RluA family pseudouridine synthase [Candidatus Anoxymicrobium japonicum]
MIREGERLDVFISSCAGVSRNSAQKLIADGLALVDGKPARKNHIIAPGEKVTWEMPPHVPDNILPQEIPVNVVHEDEHIIVVDKPAALVMYPGPGHSAGTLANALISQYPELDGVGGVGRPGIVHRLDRGTSGLVAVARTGFAYDAMIEKMRSREVERIYIALVGGSIPAETGTIDAPIGRSRANRRLMTVDRLSGKRAVSNFKVKKRFANDFTLVEVALETGRTHQIRVHFAQIGHPVAGDPEYSPGKSATRLDLSRQFLHAYRLAFSHPVTGEQLEFTSNLPEDLQNALNHLT